LQQGLHIADWTGDTSFAPDIIVDLCDAGAADSAAVIDQTVRSTVRVQQLAKFVANKRGEATAVTLLQVVSGVHSVTGEPIVAPARAAALAAARAAAREIPRLDCRAIDVSGSDAADLIVTEALIDEPQSSVAIRGRRRFVQDVASIDTKPLSQTPPDLLDGGCYLITGGLGGIGLALAEALAQRHRARVALVSRSGMPPRADWDRILRQSTDLSACERIEAVRRIEAHGQPALLLTADVADPEAVKTAWDFAVKHFGRIDGVIHAAGLAPGGSLMFRSEQDIRRVLEVKVNGAAALMNAIDSMSDKPKFVAFCSSMASLIGVAGQIDYCAANGVLDAMAQQRESQRNPRIVSINWDTWSDTGMAARAAAAGHAAPGQLEALASGLTTPQGVDAFFRALATPWPQIIVSARPVAPRIRIERSAIDSRPAGSCGKAILSRGNRCSMPTAGR